MALELIHLELTEANALIAGWHRHHKPVQGHRFSIGATNGLDVIGAAVIGRPVAPKTDQRRIVEVTRLVTDGTPNACSFLYGAAARAAKALGYRKIQTFILASESGTSLKASGWVFDGVSDGGDGWHSRSGRRSDQPTETKHRYVKELV